MPSLPGGTPGLAEALSTLPLAALPGLKPASSIKFDGINTNTFLQQFELATAALGLDGERRTEVLPLYLPRHYQQEVTEWTEFKEKNWDKIKEKMLSQFNDEEDNKFSVRDLKNLAKKQKAKPIKSVLKLKHFQQRFIRISKWLKNQERIGWQEETRIYLSAFPKSLLHEWERDKRQERRTRGKGKDGRSKAKLAKVEDIFEDLKTILDDIETYGGGRKEREVGSDSDTSEEESESESDSDSSSYVTSEETTFEDSSDEDEEEAEGGKKSKRRHHGKKKKSGRKEGGGKELKRKVSFKTETKKKEGGRRDHEALKSDAAVKNAEAVYKEAEEREKAAILAAKEVAAREREAALQSQIDTVTQELGNLKLFQGRVGSALPTVNFSSSSGIYPASLPTAPTLHAPPHLSLPNMPAALRGAGGGPFGSGDRRCFTCGGPHGFRDDDCVVMQDWISRGIVERRGRGGYYHRGERFPMSEDLPAEYPTFRDWVEAREKYFNTLDNGKSHHGNVGAYHYTPATKETSWRGQLGAHVDKGGNIQVFDVDAAKRTRADAGSSNGSREEVPKKMDTRSETTRRKENEEAPAPAQEGVKSAPEVVAEDEEMTEATSRRKKSTTMLRNPLEERISKTDVQTHLLQTTVNISLEMLLAAAPELAKAISDQCKRRRIPRPEPDELLAYQGEKITLPGGEVLDGLLGSADAVYAAPLGKLTVEVRGKSVKGLVDSGSMITVIGNNLRKSLGLTLTHSGGHTLTGINGDSIPLAGICKNVPITIGDSTSRHHIFVSPREEQQLVLGIPFLRSTSALIRYGPGKETLISLTINGNQTESVLQMEGEDVRRVSEDRFGEDGGWGNE